MTQARSDCSWVASRPFSTLMTASLWAWRGKNQISAYTLKCMLPLGGHFSACTHLNQILGGMAEHASDQTPSPVTVGLLAVEESSNVMRFSNCSTSPLKSHLLSSSHASSMSIAWEILEPYLVRLGAYSVPDPSESPSNMTSELILSLWALHSAPSPSTLGPDQSSRR